MLLDGHLGVLGLVLEPLFELADDIDFRPEIEEPVPQDVMDKILQLPYGIQASDPNGLAPEQFNSHPATVATVELFSKGFSSLEDFAAENMSKK